MPKIQLDIHVKGLERYTDFTFEPGDPAIEFKVEGREVMREWIEDENPIGEGGNDPGLTVGQDATIRKLMRGPVFGSLKLEIAEDGKLTVLAPDAPRSTMETP